MSILIAENVICYGIAEKGNADKATFYRISSGPILHIVMKWTGHSDYKTMKPYIDIVDSIKASSMTKFGGLI